jgi:hypothetical protein
MSSVQKEVMLILGVDPRKFYAGGKDFIPLVGGRMKCTTTLVYNFYLLYILCWDVYILRVWQTVL